MFTPYEAQLALQGHGLACWITILLADIFNQDVINVFLVTLATFD